MSALADRMLRNGAQASALRHVAMGALAMLASYVLVGLPLAWLAVVLLPRPSSSLDDPPGLLAVLLGLLVVAPLAVGARMQRRRATTHGAFEPVAAALTALLLALLWELRLTVDAGGPDVLRVLRGMLQLGALQLPAAWLGGRIGPFVCWLRRRGEQR